MAHRDSFWKLEHLSDAQLLESLGGVLRSQRRALAELVAHLGEVEDRRLHLEAAVGSMFTYCVARLGMSEDEACRRIELARLVRKFPALLAELESGRITLSVALVLKPVLSPSNLLELLAAARGKCIRQARELVAERFPKPDAPSSMRKLPEQRPRQASEPEETGSPTLSSAACPPLPLLATATLSSPSSASDLQAASPQMSSLLQPPLTAPPAPTPSVPMSAVAESPPERSQLTLSSTALEARAHSAAPRAGSAPPGSRSVIEPLSAQRYRIQFTADAALKQQLEQARDLLRHAHPSGDLGPIVARALTLLIDDLMRRRFGAGARRKRPSAAVAKPTEAPATAPTSGTCSDLSPMVNAENAPASASPACPSATPTSAAPTPRASHIPRTARRTVLERDGLGCNWVDAHGNRCGSKAWLELDHRQPRGKDGSSQPDNLRWLCRAHNQFAAERAYGRDHIERSMRRREAQRSLRPRE
ncbi:MAG: hypothetical protein ABI895_32225 [Deltaproteobacteria bacterium]